jgi:hypothetical protein
MAPRGGIKRVTLVANDISVGDCLKACSVPGLTVTAYSGMDRKISVDFKDVPCCEAAARLSQIAGMGFTVASSNGVLLTFDPKLPPVSQYVTTGPITICLFHPAPVGQGVEHQADDGAYGIATLGLEDEFEWDTFLHFDQDTVDFVTSGAKQSVKPDLRAGGHRGNGVAYDVYRLPHGDEGGPITITGHNFYLLPHAIFEVRLPVKKGEAYKHDDLAINVADVKASGDVTEMDYKATWDTRLPKGILDRFIRVSQTPGHTRSKEDAEFYDRTAAGARHYVFRLKRLVDGDKDYGNPGTSGYGRTRLFQDGNVEFVAKLSADACVVLDAWEIEPEGIRSDEWKFSVR